MTPIQFPLDGLPDLDRSRVTRWAPILCHPREASSETFVVGVVAVGDNDFHIECANRLSKLACLYDEAAMPIAMSIQMAVGWLEEVLSRKSVPNLEELAFPVGNIEFGEYRQTMGLGCQEVAKHWMATLSSFYEKTASESALEQKLQFEEAISEIETTKERLPVQVLGIIETQNKELLEFFHEDVRSRRARRARANARVKIDYDGMRLSANIDFFDVDKPAPTVGKLKQRMWDLAVQRERNSAKNLRSKEYEMLVDFPRHRLLDKRPHLIARIEDHLDELERQADREQIRFRPLQGAEGIGKHILEKEAA